MLLIRDIFHCKPGQVRALVDKFKKMNHVSQKLKLPTSRVMTDLCAERYWTVVTEWEVQDLAEFERLVSGSMNNEELEQAMKGYHDHVVKGRREIYTIET